jgi:hypothetical protein
MLQTQRFVVCTWHLIKLYLVKLDLRFPLL